MVVNYLGITYWFEWMCLIKLFFTALILGDFHIIVHHIFNLLGYYYDIFPHYFWSRLLSVCQISYFVFICLCKSSCLWGTMNNIPLFLCLKCIWQDCNIPWNQNDDVYYCLCMTCAWICTWTVFDKIVTFPDIIIMLFSLPMSDCTWSCPQLSQLS